MTFSFGFVGGAPSLDFVGTLILRRTNHPTELLDAPPQLDDWLVRSGLVEIPVGATEADLEDAVRLRESIFSIIDSRMSGAPYDKPALEVVNAAAKKSPVVLQLADSGRRVEASAQQALSTLARDAIALVTGPEGDLVKECGNPDCNQVYVDRSRGARREWHAMDPCGNKMKAAAYRARKRAESSR